MLELTKIKVGVPTYPMRIDQGFHATPMHHIQCKFGVMFNAFPIVGIENEGINDQTAPVTKTKCNNGLT